jgi:hypothetical protein
VGNRPITRWMMWLPSVESRGGEPDPNPLVLDFLLSVLVTVDPVCGRV